MPSNKEIALKYAGWGWRVMPVIKNGKVPATQHGVKDATVDRVQINTWWDKNPDYNVGVATGRESGIIVFDVDPRNGGTDTWKLFLEEQGDECLDNAPMQITGGRGEHWVARYDESIRSCKLLEGVDLLADGRYFIAYPSVVNGNGYDWEAASDPFDGDVEPFTVPMKWVNFINTHRGSSTELIKSGVDVITGSRNISLTALGGSLRNIGCSEPEILAALIEANEHRCVPSLPSSEIRQIARSVARYVPNNDVLGETSAGESAALALLGESIDMPQATGFHFSSAKYLIEQPAIVPFVVSKWVPAGAVGTLYGSPGVGKTFVAIDLACSVVTGRDWAGRKVKQAGAVLYMAGEGNYGIRQRVASWCQMNEEYNIGNLYISNRAIDLDSGDSHLEVIRAANEAGAEEVKLIFVDTLNRHMTGDENKATDVRKFLDSCALISAATGATVVLVHHSGHGDGAGARERGSSAIRGAMDFAIFTAKGKGGAVTIKCKKMKDASEPDDIKGVIKSASLGWIDDDGEVTNGAYFVYDSEATAEAPTGGEAAPDGLGLPEDKVAQYYRYFFEAWLATGREIIGGRPFVAKHALRNALYTRLREGHEYFTSESKVKQSIKPSASRYMVGKLNKMGILDITETGFLVKNYPHICDQWAVQNSLD